MSQNLGGRGRRIGKEFTAILDHIHSKYEASLDYMGSCLNKRKKLKQKMIETPRRLSKERCLPSPKLQNLPDRRRELTPAGCPLTSPCTPGTQAAKYAWGSILISDRVPVPSASPNQCPLQPTSRALRSSPKAPDLLMFESASSLRSCGALPRGVFCRAHRYRPGPSGQGSKEDLAGARGKGHILSLQGKS